MKMYKKMFALVFLVSAVACDEGGTGSECAPMTLHAPQSASPTAPPSPLAFREQGPPMGLYTSKIDGHAIKREDVCKLILSADVLTDPNETCTLSWYQPDTTKPERVMGLGCSMMAPFPLWDHYRETFESNNATPF